MLSLDVVRTKSVIASIEKHEEDMKSSYNGIEELIRQMKETDGLYEFSIALDKQLEELRESRVIMTQLRMCLEKTILAYENCEQKNAVYIEEVQSVLRLMEGAGAFIEETIPDHIIRLLES